METGGNQRIVESLTTESSQFDDSTTSQSLNDLSAYLSCLICAEAKRWKTNKRRSGSTVKLLVIVQLLSQTLQGGWGLTDANTVISGGQEVSIADDWPLGWSRDPVDQTHETRTLPPPMSGQQQADAQHQQDGDQHPTRLLFISKKNATGFQRHNPHATQGPD